LPSKMQGLPPSRAGEEPGGNATRRPSEAADAGRPVPVWDLPTRLFHWLTVALFPAAYFTWRMNWMDTHALIGDALLTLLLFRLLWGLCGSGTARFSCFIRSPRSATRHLVHIFRPEPDLQAGHNPAGGWMVVTLLALLLGQTLTGLYVDNDVANEGPLTELSPAGIANLITALHDTVLWDALLAAVVLHLLAILVYAVAKRQNLLAPMITGRKILPEMVPSPLLAGRGRAVLCLLCAAAASAVIANYL
jgi:cytochrome b